MDKFERKDCMIEVNKNAIPISIRKFNIFIKLYHPSYDKDYSFTIKDIDFDDINKLISMLEQARDQYTIAYHCPYCGKDVIPQY